MQVKDRVVPGKKYLLVQPVREKTTKSGLVLPSNSQVSNLAEVIESASELYPNAKFIYSKGTGHAITHEGEEFFLTHEDDVIAVVEKEE